MSLSIRKSGFTLIELLVVIAIIGILIGIVTVVAGKVMNQSHNAHDLSNLRLLGTATWSHATDHKGRLLSSRSEGENYHTQDIVDRFWIRSYGTDSNGDPRMVNVQGQATELLSTLTDGAAFPYIGDVRAYASPFDPTIGILEEFVADNPNLKPQRIRSYAFNALVGCKWGADDHWGFHQGAQNWPIESGCNIWTPTPHVCKYFLPTETISQIPQPGGTMVAIGEHDLWGRNLGGFTLHPTEMKWIDVPALWNDGLINMSFVDGSTGAIQFESKGLEEAWRQYEHDFFYTDAEDDYRKIRKVLLPGVIGNVLDVGY